MREQNFQPTGPQLDLLRFLRYRREVISGWRASEERTIRLEAIQEQIDSLAGVREADGPAGGRRPARTP